MMTHAFSMASANQLSLVIPARVALHTYATLYPVAQSALIKLAKMRGHLYEEITDQCLTIRATIEWPWSPQVRASRYAVVSEI